MEGTQGSRTDGHYTAAPFNYDGGSGVLPAAASLAQQQSHPDLPTSAHATMEHVVQDDMASYAHQQHHHHYHHQQQQQQQHHHTYSQHYQPHVQHHQQTPFYPSPQHARPYQFQHHPFRPPYMTFVPGQQQHLSGIPGIATPGRDNADTPPQMLPILAFSGSGGPPAYMHAPPVQQMSNMSLGTPLPILYGGGGSSARPPSQRVRTSQAYASAIQESGQSSTSVSVSPIGGRATGTSVGSSTLPAKPAFDAPSGAPSDVQQMTSDAVHASVLGEGGLKNEVDVTADPASSSSTLSRRKLNAPATAPSAVTLLSRLPAMPVRPDSSTMTIAELDEAYQKREEALMLRIEAIGFEPEASWKAMDDLTGEGAKDRVDDDSDTSDAIRRLPAPILGIRLLQQIDALQRENDELGRLLQESTTKSDKRDGLTIENELKDAHQLIDSLDAALTACKARAEAAEAKVRAQEQALAVACAQSSTGITPPAAANSNKSTRTAAQQHKSNRSSGSAWKAAPGGSGGGGDGATGYNR